MFVCVRMCVREVCECVHGSTFSGPVPWNKGTPWCWRVHPTGARFLHKSGCLPGGGGVASKADWRTWTKIVPLNSR